MSNRIERGAWIAVNRPIRKVKGQAAWVVPSEMGGGFYMVKEDGSCDCEDFKRRGACCKHLLAVMALDAIPRLQKKAS